MKAFFQKIWILLFKPQLRLGGMKIEPAEELLLAKVPKELWPFEIAYMRTAINSKWDKATKIRNRKYFVAGWNAAIFTKAKGYVMTEQELEKLERENERAKK